MTVRQDAAQRVADVTAAVHRMLDEHRTGPRDHSRRIWAVLVFML